MHFLLLHERSLRLPGSFIALRQIRHTLFPGVLKNVTLTQQERRAGLSELWAVLHLSHEQLK